jgi:hypothetical protein
VTTAARPSVTEACIVNAVFVSARALRLSLLRDVTVAEDGLGLLVNVADPTGPNGMRSFVVEVREV